MNRITIPTATFVLALASLTTTGCADEPYGPPPVAGTGLECPIGLGQCADPDAESSSTEAPPEREPGDALPDDELPLEAEIVVGAAYNPDGHVSETNDKCCPTGAYGLCVNDTNDTCAAGKTLTVCYGCDFTNPTDYCSTDFAADPWESQGGSNAKCTGLSYVKATGVMVHDHCSATVNGVSCTPNGDAGVAAATTAGSTPNGCPDFAAMASWSFDGAIGRMCCRTDGNSFTGYSCVPTSATRNCPSSGGGTPHTISSFCMPCTDAIGSGWHDPDGTGSNNTGGGWDLVGATAGAEVPGSIYCGNGNDDTIDEAGLPDWTGDVYKKVEYRCRGVQVNASNGLVQNDAC